MGYTKVIQSKDEKKDTRKSNHHRLGFLIVLGVPLSWSVVAGIISTTEFTRGYLMNFIHIFFIVGILGLIFTYKVAIKITGIVVGCFILFTLYGFIFAQEPSSLSGRFATLLTNTFRYIIGIESHTMAYQQVIVWVISVLISLFVVIFLYYRFVFIVLFTVLTITFSLLITSPYFSYPRSLFVFILSMLVLLIQRMHQENYKSTKMASPYSRLILPVTVACFLLVGFLPMPEQGATHQQIQESIVRPFNRINEAFYNLTQRRDFSIRQVGFGGVEGRLGGSVVMNHEVFMRVRIDGRLPLYITGATSDTYTGYSWVNTFVADTLVDFSQMEQNMELLERFTNHDIVSTRWFAHEYSTATEPFRELNPFTGEYVFMRPFDVLEVIWNLEVKHYTMEVDVTHFRPSFAFHSGIVRNITTNEEEIYFLRDREGRIRLNQRFNRGARYTVEYYLINQTPFISNLPPTFSYVGYLQWKSEHPTEHMVQTTVQTDIISRGILAPITIITIRFGDFEISYMDLLNDYLIPRAAQITEIYTTLPEDFPVAIGELAREVTAGAENNYQKMRLLEEYLSSNYSYTLRSNQPPRDLDFVYHFLFDTREGHCVYFATAFVTMARSLGLPARYVEGFLVAGIPDHEGYMDVLNSMAHAWPEVYFEGYGWHPFEPTPATGLPQLREIPETGELDWNYWMYDHLRGEGLEENREFDILEAMEREAEMDLRGVVEELEGANLSPSTVVGTFLLVVAILVLIRGGWVFCRDASWSRKGNREAVIHGFDSVLSHLRLFNYEIENGETINTFMNRVCNKSFLTNVDEKRRLEGTARIYEKARYSNQEVGLEERAYVESAKGYLGNRGKSYLGNVRYYFYRYILARII